jgi:hypothetical protein
MNMSPKIAISLMAFAMAITATRTAQAQRGGVDWGRTVKLIKDLKDQAEKYAKAFDYALGAADDVKKGKKVRTPPAYKLKDEDKKLGGMLEAIEKLQVPEPIDTNRPEFKTDPKALNGTAAEKRGEADKLIAFNRALRTQIGQMEDVRKDLTDIAAAAGRTEKAGRRLRDVFAGLYQNPVVTAFFKDEFGYAWLDLEASALPQVAEIRGETAKKAKTFEDAIRDRRRSLANHTHGIRGVLPTLGVPVPSDIRD